MEEEPEKYPKNYGMPWDEDETQQLLIEIARKLSHEEIAEKHGRTLGGIRGQLRKVAIDYYNKDMPIEKIIKYTSLSQEYIEKIIEYEKNRMNLKKEKEENKTKNKIRIKEESNPIVKPKGKMPEASTTGNVDVCQRLWNIECLLVKILDRLEKLGDSQ